MDLCGSYEGLVIPLLSPSHLSVCPFSPNSRSRESWQISGLAAHLSPLHFLQLLKQQHCLPLGVTLSNLFTNSAFLMLKTCLLTMSAVFLRKHITFWALYSNCYQFIRRVWGMLETLGLHCSTSISFLFKILLRGSIFSSGCQWLYLSKWFCCHL